MHKNIVLVIGLLLISIGLFKPYLNLDLNKPSTVSSSVVVEKPSSPELLVLSEELISTIKQSNVSKEDGLRLASLAFDISTLISLDGPNEVIKNTEEIRQANRLSGMMLRMDMNKKYPDLATKLNSVVVTYIGDDIVPLNSELRTKSCDVFKAISWAFVQGTK